MPTQHFRAIQRKQDLDKAAREAELKKIDSTVQRMYSPPLVEVDKRDHTPLYNYRGKQR